MSLKYLTSDVLINVMSYSIFNIGPKYELMIHSLLDIVTVIVIDDNVYF